MNTPVSQHPFNPTWPARLMGDGLMALGLGLSLALGMASPSLAVPPVALGPQAKVEWSQVMDDRFDGKLVYDKHYDPSGSFQFISRWSMQGIQATYTESWSDLVGYRTVWRSKWVKEHGKDREVRYRDQEPVYVRRSRDRSPKLIKFAIHQQIYTYEGGIPAPELAAALASAPAGNMTIRLVWQDDSSTDMQIGKNTVEAWRTVFKAERSARN